MKTVTKHDNYTRTAGNTIQYTTTTDNNSNNHTG